MPTFGSTRSTGPPINYTFDPWGNPVNVPPSMYGPVRSMYPGWTPPTSNAPATAPVRTAPSPSAPRRTYSPPGTLAPANAYNFTWDGGDWQTAKPENQASVEDWNWNIEGWDPSMGDLSAPPATYEYTAAGEPSPAYLFNYGYDDEGNAVTYPPGEEAPLDQETFDSHVPEEPTPDEQREALEAAIEEAVPTTEPDLSWLGGFGSAFLNRLPDILPESPVAAPIGEVRPIRNVGRAVDYVAGREGPSVRPQPRRPDMPLIRQQRSAILALASTDEEREAILAMTPNQVVLEYTALAEMGLTGPPPRSTAVARGRAGGGAPPTNAQLLGRGTPVEDVTARRYRGFSDAEAAAAERAQERREALTEREQVYRTRREEFEQRKEEGRKANLLNIAQVLLGRSTGPGGPRNFALAMSILRQVAPELAATVPQTAGGNAPNPAGISPGMWDQMTPAARRVILDAWVASGGTEEDFLATINQQRPGGRPSTSSRVQYAPLVA